MKKSEMKTIIRSLSELVKIQDRTITRLNEENLELLETANAWAHEARVKDDEIDKIRAELDTQIALRQQEMGARKNATH